MPIRLRSSRMFNAVAIVSALHLLSEGGVPVAEGTGQPYGINRQVVAGAARVGQSMGDLRPPPAFDPHPAPALSQVAATSGPPPDTTTHLSLDISVSGATPTDSALSDDQVAASLPSCDNGRGVVRYERLPDTVVDGNPIQEDVVHRYKTNSQVRLKTPSSASVLAQCVGRCLQDETALGFISRCTMFDYYPGRRINTYSTADNRFTETKCRLSRPPNQYAKINYRDDAVSIHFREVCYAASVVKAECPSRLYVMERLRNNKFEASDLLEVPARTIEECEDKCLSQYSDDAVNTNRTCRSGYFDKKRNRCYHSGFTRRTHPKQLKADDDHDYFENTCLTKDRRCPRNKLFFMKSADTELFGAYDKEYHQDLSLYECADKCLDSVNIFCRSFVYDTFGRKCMLSGEDRISKPKLVRNSTSSQKSEYYELFCMDGDKVRGNYVFDDSDTQQLNNRRHRDVPTAFQMIRNTRLDLGSGFRRFKDIPGRLTLPECLDACLEETAFVCRSVMHSDKFDACRLSKYDKLNGQTVYDPDFTYYENLMGNRITGTNQGVSGGRNPLSPFPGGGVEAGGFTGGLGGGGLGVGGSGVGLGGGLGGFAGGNGLGHSGFGISGSRCSDSTNFEPVGTRLRLRSPYIRDFETVDSLGECKRKCLNVRIYTCRSFNFRYDTVRDNCELSDESTHTILRLNNPSHFETDGSADYYERGIGSGSACLDVSQQCYEDGMEFSLRTDEPFRGRIYTYGYYDRCYTRGSGGSTTVLKISGARGVPDCGTIRYGDTTTNIVVVQFSDNVQTAMDKRYNLTCTVVGPDEAVVTSAYIGAGSGAPTPIEYLPAENQLQSQVKLQIMYNGRPTTTIAVGDRLTFRLDSLRGYNLVSDIFATDVVAKDPFSGRQVELIDSRGCPLDNYVFPALGKARDGDGLEADFDAFKIPESNYLIFEATVRTCRRGCQPALCSLGSGRAEEQSYGRKRRDAEDPSGVEGGDDDEEEEGQIHGIYEVLLSRDEFGEEAAMTYLDEVCVAPAEYYTLVVALAVTVICLLCSLLVSYFCFRRGRNLDEKNATADAGNPYQTTPSKFSFPGSHARTLTQPASYFPSGPTASAPQGEDGAATSSRYPDPSEPIYTDPALFERSRSESSPQRRFGDGQE
ncbi:uncharacterized protein LOC123507463 isoform X2 [Portunus trituberculatus]|uniref:uncharacterized protein LOC123507463 isoform X2 n=1 Tax=Portunus trituberculatus TaxID=210409 RepID=UPI001E1CFCBF|nr:uncharacterized protein LOC123507463 isoform X2 [Portunus trituberculatus]